MTIITQSLSEKKLAKQKDPLVDCLLDGSQTTLNSAHNADLENGSNSLLVTMRHRAQRVSSLTTVCVCLTALLVLTTGIVGGVYLYRQFAQYRVRQFRGWCSIPYVEPNERYSQLHQTATTNKFESVKLDRSNVEAMMNDLANQMKQAIDESLMSEHTENELKPYDNFFDEEFDIDIEFEQYERIEVPDFSHGRRGRFIHDFYQNKTGIIDVKAERCFVLPLNRSMVIPPQSLHDLILKMRTGYYDIDTEIVRQIYRVVTPPVTDYKSLGYYIARECAKMPTYRLERITSPVYKRSTELHEKVVFSEFAGKKISEIEIVNLHAAKGNK